MNNLLLNNNLLFNASFLLLFNCTQFILTNKGAHSHNKIVLCHDYYTSTLSIYH